MDREDRDGREGRDEGRQRQQRSPGGTGEGAGPARPAEGGPAASGGFGGWRGTLAGFRGIGDRLRTDRRWQVGAIVAGVVLLALALVPRATGPGPAGEPGPLRKPAARERPEVLGFFENGWSPVFGDSFPSVRRRPDLIDTISPFWYSVRSDGSLDALEVRDEVLAFARRHGITVVPLVNLLQSGGNEAGFLVDPQARQRAVAALVEEIRKRGYDGINVDFELLPPEAEPMMSQFIQELDRALPRDKRLDVSAFPKVDVDPSVHGGHNWQVFARHADRVILMAYDRHYLGSQPGPVSPGPWVEANIREMIRNGVPRQAILLGVGAYGYDWPAGAGPGNEANSTPVPLWQVRRILERHRITPERDRRSGNPHFVYAGEGGQQREVWYLDERVLAERIQMVRKHGLGGIAIWRLGYEDDPFWNTIEREFGPRPSR
ncbi:MAG TPA: glycosyl hydrolase family 18 protein [Thermaerobacter sp.]